MKKDEKEKQFDIWNELKKNLDAKKRFYPFKEGEVWWVSVGENVGVEICGKNERFSRPVLVFKKLSQFAFLGVPLTSQEHNGNWYVNFEFKNKSQYAALSQIRIFAAGRLSDRMGTLSEMDFGKVKAGFGNLYK